MNQIEELLKKLQDLISLEQEVRNITTNMTDPIIKLYNDGAISATGLFEALKYLNGLPRS